MNLSCGFLEYMVEPNLLQATQPLPGPSTNRASTPLRPRTGTISMKLVPVVFLLLQTQRLPILCLPMDKSTRNSRVRSPLQRRCVFFLIVFSHAFAVPLPTPTTRARLLATAGKISRCRGGLPHRELHALAAGGLLRGATATGGIVPRQGMVFHGRGVLCGN